MIDLNHKSGAIYDRNPFITTNDRTPTALINKLVDRALVARNQRQKPRDYLGGSRVGEPCARKLVYEITHTSKDPGRDFDGGILRIFDAGHQFEDLSIRWLKRAGFDLRDRGPDGEQIGFSAADGRLRGHADGVIVAGPDVGIRWPALFEHKALGSKSWNDLVKRTVTAWHSITRSCRSTPARRSACPTGRSRSCEPRAPANCRHALPPTLTSISADSVPTQPAAGGPVHECLYPDLQNPIRL